MAERTLATYGIRGRSVRVYRVTLASGLQLIRATWREHGRRQYERWEHSKESLRQAKAFAQGVAERLAARLPVSPSPLTLRALHDKYLSAHDDEWREATKRAAEHRLGKFLRFAGEQLPVIDVSPDLIDEYRKALRVMPIANRRQATTAPYQIGQYVKSVKELLRFARARGLIKENPLADYVMRLKKSEGRRDETFEYSSADWGKIVGALDPQKRYEWRTHCLVILAGTLGARQRALRYLTWDDVDLKARTVTWRREYDKMGKDDRVQPLPRAAVRAFRIATVWRRRDGYNGSWIFYAGKRSKDEPYTYSGLNGQLRAAEKRAGVEHIAFRAMHGWRRMTMGNVLDATGGNVKAAADWIGDDDLRTASRYAKRREVRLRDVAALVAGPEEDA